MERRTGGRAGRKWRSPRVELQKLLRRTRCIPDWPIRPWPSQGSSSASSSPASSSSQEASPSCGELSKPRRQAFPRKRASPRAAATLFFHRFRAGGVGNSKGEGWRCDFIGGAARRGFGKSRDGTRGLCPRAWKGDGSGRVGLGVELRVDGRGGAAYRVLAMRVKRNGRDWERNCWDYSKGCRAMASLIRRNFKEFKSFALERWTRREVTPKFGSMRTAIFIYGRFFLKWNRLLRS